ncbi:MAG: glutamate--tRNA ligase, partial [Alphaproteobacteria bacterium]|nr:glutamate--tRNA ligase [Alphaproteobacteria bacterium]
LVDILMPKIVTQDDSQAAQYKEKLLKAMPALKEKAKDLHMLTAHAAFIFSKRPLNIDEKGATHVTTDTCALLTQLYPLLSQLEDWTKDEIKNSIDAFLTQTEIKLGKFAPALRAVLTGSANPLGIYDILAILGKEETLARLDSHIKAHKDSK